MSELHTMHLFAGIGGGLLADLILGHKPIAAVEWDKYACKVLRERTADGWFPDLSVWEGDVRLFDPSEYAGRVDCIHAGFPCQDISVAGKQAGVGTETRSGLYREVLRIAGVVRPRYLFLENVAAIVTNGLGTVLADLAALGYDSEWLCLRASDCGANHQRDRWWLLADSKGIGHGQRRETGNVFGSHGRQNGELPPISTSTSCREDVAHTNEKKPRGLCFGKKSQYAKPCIASWWEAEPNVGRVAHGVPNRVGMLKGLGNAQVPLQAAMAWRILTHNIEYGQVPAGAEGGGARAD